MNQTIAIEQLIREGKQKLDELTALKEKKLKDEQQDRVSGWSDLLHKAKQVVPVVVRGSLCIDPSIGDISHLEYPGGLWVRDVYVLLISGLAPIKVKFESYDQIDCYSVPEIGYSINGPETYGWSWQRGEVYNTKDLSVALAEALRRYQVMVETENKYASQCAAMEELEKQQSKELEYVDEDGSEPLPDQVLLKGMRMLIREELSKVQAVQA